MRKIHVDWKKGTMVAPLARTPLAKIKVAMKLILHHLIANFSDPIFELDFLSPTSTMVPSI